MTKEFPKSKFICKLCNAMDLDKEKNPEKKVEYLKNLDEIQKRTKSILSTLKCRRIEFEQEINKRKNEIKKDIEESDQVFKEVLFEIINNLKKIQNNNN